jgi:hypothetical protein
MVLAGEVDGRGDVRGLLCGDSVSARGFAAGGSGRHEPALTHFHRAIARELATM